MEEHEKFYPSVRKNGAGGHEITIPAQIVTILGLEAGDVLKCWIRKHQPEEKEHTSLNQDMQQAADNLSLGLRQLPTKKTKVEEL